MTVQPGGQVKLTVRIERRAGFAGRVPVEVRGLPHGVRVLDIGLNGILVNENETRRTIVIYAEPWVQPGAHPFVVLAKREGKNTEHAAKSVLLNGDRGSEAMKQPLRSVSPTPSDPDSKPIDPKHPDGLYAYVQDATVVCGAP